LVQSEAVPLYEGGESARPTFASPVEMRLNRARERLADLQTKYTDEHPEVVSAKRELEQLQSLLKDTHTEEGETEGETVVVFSDPFRRQIKQDLLALDLEIRDLEQEERRIAQTIKEYQTRIERSPQIEQELAILTRNYENTQNGYETLLQKKLDAEQSDKLEKEHREEQFKVLDPATVPEVPFKPNKAKILLVGFVLALTSGLGLCFVVETMDQSFHAARDVESYLGLPVLISIPSMAEPRRD
jgi:uncharacterized protein involved in exopolysaccharide biosynthesis